MRKLGRRAGTNPPTSWQKKHCGLGLPDSETDPFQEHADQQMILASVLQDSEIIHRAWTLGSLLHSHCLESPSSAAGAKVWTPANSLTVQRQAAAAGAAAASIAAEAGMTTEQQIAAATVAALTSGQGALSQDAWRIHDFYGVCRVCEAATRPRKALGKELGEPSTSVGRPNPENRRPLESRIGGG